MPTQPPSPAEKTRRLVEQLLDRGYVDAASQTIEAITRNSTTGVMATRLAQFDAEAQRLHAAGEPMRADNPVARAVLADFEGVMRLDASLVNHADDAVQRAGANGAAVLTRELALPGLNDAQLARLGIDWNVPDPEAVASVVNITSRPEWTAALGDYQRSVVNVANDQILRGIVNGLGPLQIARDLRRTVEGLPAAQANTTLRTLQLTAYREAASVHQLANSDILEEQIRIATLDDRTCLACIALHGSRLPVGARINDHHNGRCVGVPVVKGRPRTVQTGDQWLRAQPEERQQRIMGQAAFNAWSAGAVDLRQFARSYDDPVYGPMVGEASLKSILGSQRARSFYAGPGRRPAAAAPVVSSSVRTLDGVVAADVGTPGDSLTTLRRFMEQSDGPLARALAEYDMKLLEFNDEAEWVINPDNVRAAARAFVVESQDIQYARYHIVDLGRQHATDAGVTVGDDDDAERLINQSYAQRAQAIRTAARIGGIRLTEPQQRRLDQTIAGNYLDVVYARAGSERGSLAPLPNKFTYGGMHQGARDALRREWYDRVREDLDRAGVDYDRPLNVDF